MPLTKPGSRPLLPTAASSPSLESPDISALECNVLGEWSFPEPRLQGVVSNCENNSPSEAQPPSGAEQNCASQTDTVAKQTVVLCRG